MHLLMENVKAYYYFLIHQASGRMREFLFPTAVQKMAGRGAAAC